jgi:NAD(P)-dependent dehydrogenase (short-subunit alcohol dehydrogenase family)
MNDDGVERDGLKPGDLAVITGGGGGFGLALCRRFARLGARVAIWDVDRALGAEALRQTKALGADAAFFHADFTRRDEVFGAVAATKAQMGAPYCLVNNASLFTRYSALDMAPDVWDMTFKINITAPFLIAKGFAPDMIAAQRGVIINVSSGRGVEATPKGIAYGATKAALLSITKTLAAEWARHNVRVNAIIPGVSLTAQPLAATTPEELLERGRTTIPLGRVGYPDDMAGLAAFLVTADASYMTGQGVAMNGGRVLIPQ